MSGQDTPPRVPRQVLKSVEIIKIKKKSRPDYFTPKYPHLEVTGKSQNSLMLTPNADGGLEKFLNSKADEPP